jgi:glycosyltransferase involved in cell wall biosynthesis
VKGEYKKLSKNTVYSFFKNTDLPVLVFIGRLTAIKKLDLLFHAVHLLSEQNLKTNLVIIGDGPERENLEILRKNFHAEEYIYFTGASYNELEVGRYLFKADLCISPGNIGLTAIHSLSYGTPICTHNNFNNQMPEAEAIIEGYNGFYFNENDLTDLVKNVKCWLTNNKDREIVRNRCYRIIDQFYNPNYQLKVFNQLINNQDPEL